MIPQEALPVVAFVASLVGPRPTRARAVERVSALLGAGLGALAAVGLSRGEVAQVLQRALDAYRCPCPGCSPPAGTVRARGGQA